MMECINLYKSVNKFMMFVCYQVHMNLHEFTCLVPLVLKNEETLWDHQRSEGIFGVDMLGMSPLLDHSVADLPVVIGVSPQKGSSMCLMIYF